MLFNSTFFIVVFLPLALAAHWLVPGIRGKNAVLLVFSLLFYSMGSLPGLLLLIGVTLVNYLLGQALKGNRCKKVALIAGLVLNLAFLGFFKYTNFVLTDILRLPPLSNDLAVPLGISFFTFKSISYLMDTYRDGKNTAGSFWIFCSIFPSSRRSPWDRSPASQSLPLYWRKEF